MSELKEGDKIEVQLAYITQDKKGVAWNNGKMVLIEGVVEDDGVVHAEIVRVLEETILAKRISRLRKEKPISKVSGAVDSPYEMDEDLDMDDEDDDEYQEEGETNEN